MNTTECTSFVRGAEYVETPAIEESPELQQPAPGKPVAAACAAGGAVDVRRWQCDARVAYGLLAVVTLLSAWMIFTLNQTIDEINANLDGLPAIVACSPSK